MNKKSIIKDGANKNLTHPKKQKGITLIALILTIVILIILATISINAVMGEDGLIRRAEKAAEHQANAEARENEAMDILDKYISNSGEKEDEESTNDNLTFFVTSDIHLDSTAQSYEDNLEETRKMGNLANEHNASFVINLGDTIGEKDNKNKSVQDLQMLVNETKNNTTVPVFFARGNHDDNGWYSEGNGGFYQTDEMINDVEWNTIVNNSGNITKDANNTNGGYFYYDDEKSKVRVFVLDTEDIPYYVDYTPISNGKLKYIDWEKGSYFIKSGNEYVTITEEDYNSYSTKPQLYLYGYRYSSFEGHAFRNQQLNFIAKNLISMESDWGALFMMHVPLDTSKEDGERFGIRDALIRNHDILLAIITAWKNGTKCVLSGDGGYTTDKNFLDKEGDFAYDISVDYTSRGKGEVIAFISGHTHWNNTSDEVGFKTSLSYGYRYISIGSGYFSKIVINREEQTISVVRYGDLITPSNTSDQEAATGVNEGEVYSGSLESGSYVVKYDQFYPELKNLINTNWDTTTEYQTGHNMSVNMNNYEVTLGDANTNTNYETFLVAIPVRPYTTYTLGSVNQNGVFVGEIMAMTQTGTRSGVMAKTINEAGNTVIKTGPRQYAIVINVNTSYKEGLMVVEGETLPENYISY